MLGLYTESEHPRLSNREIITIGYLNVTDGRTDRRLAIAIGEIAYQ